jgi:hypothetical protein
LIRFGATIESEHPEILCKKSVFDLLATKKERSNEHIAIPIIVKTRI